MAAAASLTTAAAAAAAAAATRVGSDRSIQSGGVSWKRGEQPGRCRNVDGSGRGVLWRPASSQEMTATDRRAKSNVHASLVAKKRPSLTHRPHSTTVCV